MKINKYQLQNIIQEELLGLLNEQVPGVPTSDEAAAAAAARRHDAWRARTAAGFRSSGPQRRGPRGDRPATQEELGLNLSARPTPEFDEVEGVDFEYGTDFDFLRNLVALPSQKTSIEQGLIDPRTDRLTDKGKRALDHYRAQQENQ